MADLFRNRYRIPSARRPKWDYAWSANYFITICTKDRLCYFGEVESGEMRLSEIGGIVKEEWERTAALRPDMNLFTDVFVVMPNHFHAIVSIGDNRYNSNAASDDAGRDAMHRVSEQAGDSAKHGADETDGCRDAMHRVSGQTDNSAGQDGSAMGNGRDVMGFGRDAMHRVSTGQAQDDYANAFGPQAKNLSSIVRGFKSAVTGRARQIHADFGWQARFHDHVIRTEDDYDRIHRYILNNPLSWKEDRFHPDNLTDL